MSELQGKAFAEAMDLAGEAILPGDKHEEDGQGARDTLFHRVEGGEFDKGQHSHARRGQPPESAAGGPSIKRPYSASWSEMGGFP